MEANILLYRQFLSDFFATLIGVILGGVITLLIALWQMKRQSRNIYISTLKTIFSELQDNERTLREGERFDLEIHKNKYKPLLVFLCNQVISGSLASERLGYFANHKLISSLVTVERKLSLHNMLVSKLMDMLSIEDWNSKVKIDLFIWFYGNLEEKQKIIAHDCKSLMSVLEAEIVLHANREEFLKYLKKNKDVESYLKHSLDYKK